jgi:hypothetical protein
VIPDDRKPDRRRLSMPPDQRRQVLVLAVSGLSIVVALAVIALLLHFAG